MALMELLSLMALLALKALLALMALCYKYNGYLNKNYKYFFQQTSKSRKFNVKYI